MFANDQPINILADVQKLLPPNLMPESTKIGIFRAYNTETLKTALVPGCDRRMVVSKMGEVDPTHYIDPAGGQVVGFNHLDGSTLRVELVCL